MEKNKISTATCLINKEDSISYGWWYENKKCIDSKIVKKLMKEFAKLHVEAALKAASEKLNYKKDFYLVKNEILNAYPLENIK